MLARQAVLVSSPDTCSNVTTEEARALVQALDDAELERSCARTFWHSAQGVQVRTDPRVLRAVFADAIFPRSRMWVNLPLLRLARDSGAPAVVWRRRWRT